MPKFFLEKITSTDRKTAFELFSNFENYQKLFPRHFPSVRIRSMRGNTSVVEEHMQLGGLELVIMAKHVLEEPLFHEVFVIGGDAKGSHIKQEFVELEKGTKILVDVDLKFKGRQKISNLFKGNNFQDDYEVILDDFIEMSES